MEPGPADDAAHAQPGTPLDLTVASEVDRSQPWQTQYAETLSRGINRDTPYVRRQLRLAGFCALGLLATILLLFVITMLT